MSKYSEKVARQSGLKIQQVADDDLGKFIAEICSAEDRKMRETIILEVPGDAIKSLFRHGKVVLHIGLNAGNAVLLGELVRLSNCKKAPKVLLDNVPYGLTMRVKVVKNRVPNVMSTQDVCKFLVVGNKNTRPRSKKLVASRRTIYAF